MQPKILKMEFFSESPFILHLYSLQVDGKDKELELEEDSGTSSISLIAEHIDKNILTCPICSNRYKEPRVGSLLFYFLFIHFAKF